jgi:hypothetical protein
VAGGLVNGLGQPLVTVNATYYDGRLKVSSIRWEATVTPASSATPKEYRLVIAYNDGTSADNNSQRNAFVGKKQSVIEIPMYMKVVSGVISECFAMTENKDVDLVISQSCSPITANTNRKSALSIKLGVAVDCSNQFNFSDNTNILLRNSTCSSNKVMTGFSLSAGVPGTDITAVTGNTVNISPNTSPDYCASLPGTASSSNCPAAVSVNGTTVQQVLYSLSSSAASCAYTGVTRDPPVCGAGQLLWRSSASSLTCVTANCPNLNEFINSVTSSGTTCFKAPATTCSGTQYVKEFRSNGTYVCDELPVMTGNCAGSTFGYSITRATATAGGQLNCAAYNKAKTCGVTSTIYSTFAYSFNSSTTASCRQW